MTKLLIISASLLFANTVQADLNKKMDQMCGKIKQCSLESAGAENMPPEVQAMMTQMFDGLCKSMLQPYYASIGQAGLEDKAEACMDSFLDVSCEVMMENQGEAYSSPECDDFKAAADEAGVDLGQ